MLDLLIKNGNIIDGCGTPAFEGDIAVKDGVIVEIGTINQEAKETIDAKGQIVAPGFIDVHGHSDLFAFVDPNRASKLCQGITTEICGQCGLGPAPVPTGEALYQQYAGYLKSLGAPLYPKSKEFTFFGAYLNFMETLPLGINTAYFIPHGMVRLAVMGLSSEKPSLQQLEQMKELVRDGMEAGVLGLSSGLMYAPGIFAGEEELTALCEVVGEYGGIYTSHLRDQGRELIESVAETIRIGKNANVRVNISHNKASGKDNWGKVIDVIQMIHEADIPVGHDVYPYTAGSSSLLSTLPHYLQNMTPGDILPYLMNKENHETLKDAIFNPSLGFESPLYDCGYEGLIIFHAQTTLDAVGKSINQYALELEIDPFQAYLNILIDNQLSAGYIGFSMSEDDVKTLMADSFCMFGTDGLYVEGMPMTHPRAIGTFPRILGRYVREEGLLALEEAIRKMTSLPAQFYGLEGKGQLKVGLDGDLVIFDPDRIMDQADFKKSLLPNVGLHRVIVDGKVAVADDKPLNERYGKVIRINQT